MHAIQILDASVALLRAHWKPLVGVVFASFAVSGLLSWMGLGLNLLGLLLALPGGFWSVVGLLGLSGAACLLVQLALLALTTGIATTYVVFNHDGRTLGFGDVVQHAVRRLHIGLGVGFIMSMLTIVTVCASFPVVGSLMPGIIRLSGGPNPILQLVGVFLVLLPTIALCIALTTLAPVAFLERRGVFASVARAWRMLRGHRIQVFRACVGAAVLAGIVSYATDWALQAVLVRISMPVKATLATSWLVDSTVDAVIQAWMIVIAAVVYLSVRGQEGSSPATTGPAPRPAGTPPPWVE